MKSLLCLPTQTRTSLFLDLDNLSIPFLSNVSDLLLDLEGLFNTLHDQLLRSVNMAEIFLEEEAQHQLLKSIAE